MKKEEAIIESLVFWSCIMLAMVFVYYMINSAIGYIVNVDESEIPQFFQFIVKHSFFLKLTISTISYMTYLFLVRFLIFIKTVFREKKNVSMNMVACKFDVYASLLILLFIALFEPSISQGADIDFASYILAIIFGFIFGENLLFEGFRKTCSEIKERFVTLYNSIKKYPYEFVPSIVMSSLLMFITVADVVCPLWPFYFVALNLLIVVGLLIYYKLIPWILKKI